MEGMRPRNALLARLAEVSPATFAALARRLEPVPLARGMLLGAAPGVAEQLYFVESGIVSLIATTRAGESLEVALIGREGVTGIADALGRQPLPYEWVVQIPGVAYDVPIEVVRDHIHSCSHLHALLMSYSQLVMHQLTQSALCNRFHTSVQRLARWLLLTATRAETESLALTHEHIAHMVGAPRSAVTSAVTRLKRAGLIDTRRGGMRIRDAGRLRSVACECVDVVLPVLMSGSAAPAASGSHATRPV